MDTSKDLERLARAAWQSLHGVPSSPYRLEDQPEEVQRAYLQITAAILHELMNPSQEMIEAACKHWEAPGCANIAPGVFTAMIRHVLGE